MFKMFLCLVVIILVAEVTVVSGTAHKCACASVDTPICSTYPCENSTFGTLSAPNCLPYKEAQRAENDGRTFANVSFYGKPAWLLTSDIYIKDCKALFGCVCALETCTIHANHQPDSLSLMTLPQDQCIRLKGKQVNCNGDAWTPIDANGQTGWIQNGSLVFHKTCSQPTIYTCPCITSRAEWGARDALPGVGRLTKTPDYAIIHHGASVGCYTREDCERILQSYQNFHMDGRGWYDIGYNFMVGEDGNIYEGRGWDAVGAHTYGYNSKSLGFAVVGNFTEHPPNQAAVDALRKLLACGVTLGKLSPTYTLYGRCDVGTFQTESPGKYLHAIIQDWEHFNYTAVNN